MVRPTRAGVAALDRVSCSVSHGKLLESLLDASWSCQRVIACGALKQFVEGDEVLMYSAPWAESIFDLEEVSTRRRQPREERSPLPRGHAPGLEIARVDELV